jgi:hypothetical protein
MARLIKKGLQGFAHFILDLETIRPVQTPHPSHFLHLLKKKL